MATKQTTATKAPEQARVVTVTKTVTVPTFKRCAAHSENFPGEDPIRPISEFWGQVPGSYCKRCASLKHKATRSTETARRQRDRADLKEFRINKEAFEAWKASQGQQGH